MFIVEGPDGAGKTRLIEKLLRDRPELELMAKAVASSGDSLTNVPRYVEQSIDRGFGPYLYDRHALISEPIYGPAWKGSVRAKFDDFHWLSIQYALLSDIQPVVIVCLPSFDEVWGNIQRDEDNKRLFPNRLKMGRVYWQYHALIARNMDWLKYNYLTDDYNMILGHVSSVLELRCAR